MIETDRLILRPLEESDFEALKSIWGDGETMSFYAEPYSDERIKEIIFKQITTYQNDGFGLFAVLDKTNGSLIGDCGITIQHIDGVDEFEIGYHIRKQHWGLGYAAEAAGAIKRYGFEVLKIDKLCSYMETKHKQSRRVAEKIGMKVEKEYRNPRNRNLDTIVYSIKNANKSVDTTSGAAAPSGKVST